MAGTALVLGTHQYKKKKSKDPGLQWKCGGGLWEKQRQNQMGEGGPRAAILTAPWGSQQTLKDAEQEQGYLPCGFKGSLWLACSG